MSCLSNATGLPMMHSGSTRRDVQPGNESIVFSRGGAMSEYSLKTESIKNFSLLPSREKVRQRLGSFCKTAGMRGCLTRSAVLVEPYPSPSAALPPLPQGEKGRTHTQPPAELDPHLRGDDDKGERVNLSHQRHRFWTLSTARVAGYSGRSNGVYR
jgi:hypothetical protein